MIALFVLAVALAACANPGPAEVTQASTELQPTQPPANATRAEIDSPLGSYLAGRLARHDADMVAAARFFSRALAHDLDNVDLLRQTFLAVHADGRAPEAVDLARRLFALKPNESISGLLLAADAIKRGDLEAANGYLDSLPRKGYNMLLVPLLTAWAAAGEEHFEAAGQELDALKKRDRFKIFLDFHTALVNDIAGNAAEAEEAYRAALTGRAGASYRVVTALGSFLERRGRPEAALELYEAYQDENPDSLWFEAVIARVGAGRTPEPMVRDARDGAAEALFDVASTLYQENALGPALAYARMAVYLRPAFDAVNLLLAEIFEARQRPDQAIAAYQAIGPSSPLIWSVRQRIAANLDELDRTDEAVANLRSMAAERPERADASIALGGLLRAKERWVESVAAYDEALRRTGEPEERHWRLFYARGVALERSNQWTRAENDFLEALDLKPDQPFVLNYLGYSWVDQGINLERALTMIERAVELRPNDGYIIDSLGWAMYRLGKFADAVAELERAVELRPEDATINDHLGDAYWRVGRRNEARFQWRRVLGLDSEEEELVERVQAKLRDGLLPGADASDGG